MLYITSIEANSLTGASSLSKVYKFTPEDSQIFQTRGQLFAVLSIKSEEQDLENLATAILQSLKSAYFEALGDSFNALRKAVEKVQNDFSDRTQEFDLVVTSYAGGVIYSAVLGGGEVSILRRGMIANILSGRGPIIVASGYPEEEDLLILGTADFFLALPSYDLKKLLENESLAEVEAKLQSTLSTKQDSGKSAILVLVFGTENNIKTESIAVNSSVLQQKSTIFDSLSSIKTKISGFFPSRRIFVKTGLEEREEDGKKKTTITVGIILLVLLLISIAFGVRQRSLKLTKSRYEARLNQAIHDFDEASSLISLDSTRARELFAGSQEVAKTLEVEGVKDERLVELLKKIGAGQANILKEFKEDPIDFVDLGLLSNSFRGSDLASSGVEIFALDASSKKVVQVSIENKKAQVVAGPENFDSAKAVAAYEDKFFVLTPDGIKELGDKNEIVVPKDWSEESLVYSYAGNLYVLDKGASSVSRYPGVQAGFASKQNWFGAGVVPDLNGTTSWVIDGNVWILTTSGKILKFTLGSPQAFSVSGIGQSLNSPTNIYTNENLEYLYILDPKNARLVVVGKEGVYKAQYVSDQFKSATDLVVSEKDKRAVILIDGNLKSIELRHL